MRMVYLGQIINSFFSTSHQPMMIFYSPNPGQTGKSPTAYYTRQILDPQKESISAAPSTVDAFIRLMAASRVVVLDEATRKNVSHALQKRLDSYSTGGKDKLKKLYSSVGLMTIDPGGLTVLTTNTADLLIEDTTKSRAMTYNFEILPRERAKEISVALADFERDLNIIRGTLFTLIAEVIKLLPNVSNQPNGHRFQLFNRIVDSLHQILNVPGSMARTLSNESINTEGNRDFELLINDVGIILSKAGTLNRLSATKLYTELTRLNKGNTVAINERSECPDYPSSSKTLLNLLKDGTCIDQLSKGSITMTVDYCSRNKADKFTFTPIDKSVIAKMYGDLAGLPA